MKEAPLWPLPQNPVGQGEQEETGEAGLTTGGPSQGQHHLGGVRGGAKLSTYF